MTDSPESSIRSGLVLYAKDKDGVAQFYKAALDLETRVEEDGFVVPGAPGIELTVVRIPEGIAAGIEIASPPQAREDTPFKPSFLVPSLEGVRAAIASTGGQLRPAGSEWLFRGFLHLDGWDPEGNIVQFRRLEAASDMQ